MIIDDEQFEAIVMEAWAQIPERFKEEMENISIHIELSPAPHQLRRLKMRDGNLLGLYDGVPKTAWGQAQMGVQPSKITLFQEAIMRQCNEEKELRKLVKQVLMHEIAHYFGYSEEDMKILDAKYRKNNR